jgi:hypothetical protein
MKRGAAAAIAAMLGTTGSPPAVAHGPVDLHRLPLGDGRISTGPRTGYIWACRTDPNAGGAFRDGPWIRSDGTYDFTAKAVVDGSVRWPSRYRIDRHGDRRSFTANDLPDHPTGIFPIAPSDDAFRYDRNPNAIREQAFEFSLPADPQLAPRPSCVPGAVGILSSGAVLFNALDAPGRDAVAHETQDSCQGHPQRSGVYHYHSLTTCLEDRRLADGHSALVGYALDGFGIFGRHGEGGRELTSADLDECHGHSHAIPWDGRTIVMYHYHATWDFPYTIGCLRGAWRLEDMVKISGGEGAGPPRGPGGRRPDLAAAASTLGIGEEQLRTALGPPPPDLGAVAKRLGISEKRLREALGVPER